MGNQMLNTMKKLLPFIVLLFAFLTASAQEISVKSFKARPAYGYDGNQP